MEKQIFMTAANWNVEEDFYNMAWNQQLAQFWLDTEFNVSKDLPSWDSLTYQEKDVYKKVLAGLTGLDTLQNQKGMSLFTYHSNGDDRINSVFSLFDTLEAIHAKSYSTIFTTLIPSKETKELLEVFVRDNQQLQYKAQVISEYYNKLLCEKPINIDLYMSRVASVFLESFLFYSGFFYPLYLAGQGKMVTSGEIIRKILLDETVHGNVVGFNAQELYNKLTEEEKDHVDREVILLLENLYANEVEWCYSIYDQIGLTDEVLKYVRYNANRALTNLGRSHYFEHQSINPIVLTQTDTQTKNHDFFSTKGDGYVMTTKTEEIDDSDFYF